MENKLISMTAFVLNEQRFKEDDAVCNFRITNYAHFLSQPLKLDMFVQAGDDGEFLENCDCVSDNGCCVKRNTYNESLGKVLFEGFNVETDMHNATKREIIWLNKPINKVFLRLTFYNGNVQTRFMPDDNIKTVEDLLKYNLTLTPTSLKQIYG